MEPTERQFDISLHHHEGPISHTITAHTDKGNKAGSLEWNKSSGKIEDIDVHPEARRQGIASHMWDLAHQVSQETSTPAPRHSPERTPDGDAWAKSVGGRIPEHKVCTACGDTGHLATEHGE
jgi:GNAT superfamily N-acetyltransferase